MTTSDQLQQAYHLIKDGNKIQAAAILVPIVRAEPNNADAWWLLANAVSSPEQQRRALEQVLRLRPNDEKARRMLDKITGGTSSPLAAADPFAGSSSYSSQQPYDPFADSAPQPDPFTAQAYDDSDPFAHVGGRQQATWGSTPAYAPPVVVERRKGTSPFVVFLAIIGVIGIISCGICAVATGGFAVFTGQVIQQVANDPEFATAMQQFGDIGLTLTADPNFSGLAATLSSSLGASSLGITMPDDYNQRGTVELGQTVNGTVGTNTDDGWIFTGSSGSEITIEVRATDDDLDPQLYVFGPDNTLLAQNDDINLAGGNRNSRVEVTLPETGKYSIIISAFSEGGDYELSVR